MKSFELSADTPIRQPLRGLQGCQNYSRRENAPASTVFRCSRARKLLVTGWRYGLGMLYSHTNTGLRAYMRVVASRNASTTIVLWIQRVMLATMQAELVSWRNVSGNKDASRFHRR